MVDPSTISYTWFIDECFVILYKILLLTSLNICATYIDLSTISYTWFIDECFVVSYKVLLLHRFYRARPLVAHFCYGLSGGHFLRLDEIAGYHGPSPSPPTQTMNGNSLEVKIRRTKIVPRLYFSWSAFIS